MTVNKIIFVGEEPSKKALEMGVTWEDGRLAAKQLFDAFERIGFDVENAEFINLFDQGKVRPDVLYKLQTLTRTDIVGMGQKVQLELIKNKIKHWKLIHPAARGAIRKKEINTEHVYDVMNRIKANSDNLEKNKV